MTNFQSTGAIPRMYKYDDFLLDFSGDARIYLSRLKGFEIKQEPVGATTVGKK